MVGDVASTASIDLTRERNSDWVEARAVAFAEEKEAFASE
jgi:hypothetical protein